MKETKTQSSKKNTSKNISKLQISADTVSLLRTLARKYETKDFLTEDPSQFLYWYKKPVDTELAAFTAALLSFGNRKQFIPKIKYILSEADISGGIYHWIKNRDFEKTFSVSDNTKFYRFYSYRDMYYLFNRLFMFLDVEKSLGIFFHTKYVEELNRIDPDTNKPVQNPRHLIDVIADCFPDCAIVPQTKTSAKKRLCMFLRWMVRTDSPVDIGLWPWFSSRDLIIPLDVHVISEAQKLGLIAKDAPASRKTAEKLTETAREIFDDDPCRLDFALFGKGVN